ncbi:tautomerase family protein [Furfurilactobacillus milii]|uniref:4-oxalocrotonate tautomerase n=1 Tax=Furfurilactobacillus milii TaxID=2888272 RepID=A0A6N9I3Z1_9LACO|nr:tautomerase family protein [Furfurilactobacillus milii]MYV17685.1 4-oxalocrotonate tautomerase [Furfurilactobacillus milii]
MPYLRVRIASPKTTVTAQKVAAMLTQLAVDKLGKAGPVAAVDVHFTDPNEWFIGAKSVAETNETSFFVEIKITESTNSRDDKAAFVKATFEQMSQLFPNIASTSYVVLQDVASDSWGYGGKTQEFRYITGDAN